MTTQKPCPVPIMNGCDHYDANFLQDLPQRVPKCCENLQNYFRVFSKGKKRALLSTSVCCFCVSFQNSGILEPIYIHECLGLVTWYGNTQEPPMIRMFP